VSEVAPEVTISALEMRGMNGTGNDSCGSRLAH